MPLNSVSKNIRIICGYVSLLGIYQYRIKKTALKKFAIFFMSVLVIGLASCKHQIPGINDSPGSNDNNPPASSSCSADTAYFQQQVLPIFISNCAMSGCHDNTTHKEGIVLTSYTSIMFAGIRPGYPSGSKIYKVITTSDPGDRMPEPPRNPLTQEQIALINKWITQGAKNNSCVNASCDTANVTFSSAIRPIITNKCQGCHSSSSPGGGYDLSTYTGVKARVNDGRLWGAINYVAGYSAMPKNGIKLSTCELAKIRKWIEAGAPNN